MAGGVGGAALDGNHMLVARERPRPWVKSRQRRHPAAHDDEPLAGGARPRGCARVAATREVEPFLSALGREGEAA